MTYSGSPNPDPGEVKRDEETLQRQRDEKAEQDRLEEERRILEQEVPFWRRQKQLEGGEFTQDPEGPHYASLGTEMAIGIGTDFATGWMLATPLAAAYYPINFGAGWSANALAQWMRGEDEFNYGEALAAGTFQTIPMGTTAKGIKGLTRATAKGAAGGIGQAQLEVGIDEQRRLTAKEVLLSGTLGGVMGGGTHQAADALRDVTTNTVQGLRHGLAGTSISDMTGGRRWERFGYYADYPEPSQVNNPRYTALEKAKVAGDLEKFYDRVLRWEGTGKKVRQYPLYWLNPVTNRIYKVARKGRTEGRRLTLESKNRYFQEKVQSSITQRISLDWKKRSIARENKAIEQSFLSRRNELVFDIDEITRQVQSLGAGKPGSSKNMTVQSILSVRQERVKELEDLISGKAKMYGEHGYNLANQRVQKIVKPWGWSLGNATNFHPTLNRDNFKQFKDKLETVINSTNRRTGVYNYPNLIVNYNPKLHGGVEYIIRIEKADTIRQNGPFGINPGVVHGDLAPQTPDGIQFYDIPIDVRRGNTRDIRRWLQRFGYNEQPNPNIKSDLADDIRTNPRPLESKKDTIKRIKGDN